MIERFINSTQRWIDTWIIAHNLCPFAKPVFDSNLIRYQVWDLSKSAVDDTLIDLTKEAQFLLKSNPKYVETTIVIFSKGLENFNKFLGYYELCLHIIKKTGYDEDVQLAIFHPEFIFEGTSSYDVSNKTNRSPYPLIHLLRVDSVNKAIHSFGDTDSIWKGNIKKMKELFEDNQG